MPSAYALTDWRISYNTQTSKLLPLITTRHGPRRKDHFSLLQFNRHGEKFLIMEYDTLNPTDLRMLPSDNRIVVSLELQDSEDF
jgi:hypothetical protein